MLGAYMSFKSSLCSPMARDNSLISVAFLFTQKDNREPHCTMKLKICENLDKKLSINTCMVMLTPIKPELDQTFQNRDSEGL